MGGRECAMENMGRMTNLFDNAYAGRRILVTGHTGFKGSWLTLWLTFLGARVVGVSAHLPSTPCNFSILGLSDKVDSITLDIRELGKLKEVFNKYQPEVVFHLAAQAIVKKAYTEPKLTFETNLGGTINVLECIRATPNVRVGVIITSDKCYQNVEWTWGYRENDRLGGDDPYSASKACSEIACQAYIKSFFRKSESGTCPRIATTRAGNVIGGGDWAEDRIIPDCVRALVRKEDVVIRNPNATRPWQHVLEPLSGYLWLGAKLMQSDKLHGEAFNFGPDQKVNQPVKELIKLFTDYWGYGKWKHDGTSFGEKENTLLKLSCDKALHYLAWHSVLTFYDTVRLTAEWYKGYYSNSGNMFDYSRKQIEYFISEARSQRLPWAEVV
jgi:CDP-glucose 4,6-dehydratase